ncbi:MAG: hypothetical protein H7A25_07160 [Leptospiraceae bacterium]|nr:hypothetical protein [Leptospiraceae bacterium]MCP5499662.1 hypothetical protein [Leptospiraceae bacterium]
MQINNHNRFNPVDTHCNAYLPGCNAYLPEKPTIQIPQFHPRWKSKNPVQTTGGMK